LFNLNENCEVVGPPRKVFGPYSTLKTQEVTAEALGLEPPHEKVCNP